MNSEGDLFKTIVGINQGLEVMQKLVQAVEKGYEMAFEGAIIQRFAEGNEILAKTIGTTSQEIVDSMVRATGGTISELEAMEQANHMLLLGVAQTPEEFGKFSAAAIALGRATGRTAAESIADLTRGVGRMEKRILDNIGITYDADEVYSSWAATLGKTAKELTKTEKQQALMNLVLEKAQPLLDENGNLTDDLASNFEWLAAEIEDATNKAKTWWAEFWDPFLSNLRRSSEENDILKQALDANILTQEEYQEKLRTSTWMENASNEAKRAWLGYLEGLETKIQSVADLEANMGLVVGATVDPILKQAAAFNVAANALQMFISQQEILMALKTLPEEEYWLAKGIYQEQMAGALNWEDALTTVTSGGSGIDLTTSGGGGYARRTADNTDKMVDAIDDLGITFSNAMLKNAQFMQDLRRMLDNLPIVIKDIKER